MFNINDVSRMLREARIQKNLTQNALADQMGVTYQAVSNWERGTSVPDISNLARLCEILELDLYKLVGASQSRELTEELLASPDRLDSAPVDAIAAVAPMLPPRELEELVRAKKADIRNLSTLTQIAPFIDAALAEEIGAELTPAHIADVLGMSPFVSPELCAKWVERLEQQGDFELDTGLLSALGPFLPQERMDRLSERVVPGEPGHPQQRRALPFAGRPVPHGRPSGADHAGGLSPGRAVPDAVPGQGGNGKAARKNQGQQKRRRRMISGVFCPVQIISRARKF